MLQYVNIDNDELNVSPGSVEYDCLYLLNAPCIATRISKNLLYIFERSYTVGKTERSHYMGFASYDGLEWEVIGKDNDDLSKELNPDTEISRNVLGESIFKHNGYKPEVAVDPYYADATSALYEKLSAAAIQEKYGETDIKGYYAEVIFTTATDTTLTGTGYKRDAYIVPQSTGGDTSGLSIPYTVNPIGAMTAVTVTYTIATHAVTIVNVAP